MNFDRQIRLVFHAVVGRDDLYVPIVRPVLGLASQQLMLIYADGSLDAPRTRREALPAVRQAVEDLQNDLNQSNESRTILGHARDLIEGLGIRD